MVSLPRGRETALLPFPFFPDPRSSLHGQDKYNLTPFRMLDLTMAKALGGPGDAGKTNPEELFAAGYGACFQSAVRLRLFPSSALSMQNPSESTRADTSN